MKYFNAKEAAKYIGKSERTIRRWIRSGQLAAKRKGNRFLISQNDLDSLTGHDTGQADTDLSALTGQVADKERTSGQDDSLSNANRIADKLEDILQAIERSRDNAVVTYTENPLVEELRDDRNTLRQENAKLWNLLGQAQGKVQELENKVKMLEAPRDEEKQKQRQIITQILAEKESEKKRAVKQVYAKADEIVQRSKQEVMETRGKIAKTEKQIELLEELLQEEQNRSWWDRLWGR